MLEEYLSKISPKGDFSPYQLGASVSYYSDTFPDLSSKKIALLGVGRNDDHAQDNIQTSQKMMIHHLILHSEQVGMLRRL